MKGIFLTQAALISIFLSSIFFFSCIKTDDEIPKPVISVAFINSSNLNEDLSGLVHGIDFELYNMVIYAKIQDGWYSLPDREFPLTPIDHDNSWICTLADVNREQISEFSVYLVPNGYNPPILQGESMIPIKMNLVSAAKKNILIKNN